MFSNLCYRYHYNRSRTFKLVVCLLLLFVLFSTIVQPKQADAFVWALPALAGGEALVDLVLGGLFAGGVIAADTYIKNSDLYKTVTAFLGSLTAEELAKVEEIGSAGQAAYSTAAISGLLSKALTACDGLTVYPKTKYTSLDGKMLMASSLAEYGFTAEQIKVITDKMGAPSRYDQCLIRVRDLFLVVAFGGGTVINAKATPSKYDPDTHKPIEYNIDIGNFKETAWAFDVTTNTYGYLTKLPIHEDFLVYGSFYNGWSTGYGFTSTSDLVAAGFVGVYWLYNDLYVNDTPDVINVPEAGLSICPDVTLAPDVAIAENWAADYTMSDSIATSPSVTLNPELAGDVVITPGDIGGGGEVVDPDVPTDGTIAGLLSALLDWLKGILQSILDAIRSIPAAITAFIASLFDVTQFQLDFTPFKSLVIKDKFPFCIPFDFRNAVKSFASTASDYQMRIDLETSYFEVHHTVDLSPFVIPIAFFRYAACVWFTLILVTRTKDLMKW